MLALSGEFDAFLCGDDAITRAVIDKSLPRLKIISKYGSRLAVLNTPGVNHTTFAEDTFGLLLSLTKKIQENAQDVRDGMERCASMDDVLHRSDVVSLHCFLDDTTRGMIASPALSLARVIDRVARGGHNVPDDKLANRHPRTMANLSRLIPVADRLTIDDNRETSRLLRPIA